MTTKLELTLKYPTIILQGEGLYIDYYRLHCEQIADRSFHNFYLKIIMSIHEPEGLLQ